MPNYIKATSRPKYQQRWWLKSRLSKNAFANYSFNNGKELKLPVYEIYCPVWAKPLDWLHGKIFGKMKIIKG